MLILAVLAFEAITNNAYPRPRRWDNWRHPVRYVEILMERNTGGRVLPLPFYTPNVASVFEQPSIDSLTLFTAPRMFAFYQRHFNPQEDFFLRGTRELPPDRILDFANIEYVALNAAVPKLLAEAARRGYETLYADGFVHLVRRSTTPRYSFTSDYRVAASAEAALDALPSLPANTVVLEARPSFPPMGGAEQSARTRLAHFSLNEVEIAVDAPRAGVLVCSESHMRGWSATVDGRPAPILAANYAFRAVEVPAGSHVVRLRYRAPGFLPGLLISAGGVIVCWFGLRRRRPALPPREP
jgi:hypothetical protein